MKTFSMAMAFALGITLLGGSIASAQNGGQVQNASYGSIQDMIGRIESIEGTLVGYNASDDCCGSGVQCGSGCAKCCNDQSAVYFGVEMVVAKPYFEDEVEGGVDSAFYDTEISPRFYGGFSNANGFGGRVRYWQWDHTSRLTAGSSDDEFRLNVQALDLEMTTQASLGAIDMMLFGGTRYGRVEHKDVNGEGQTFEGFGPTVGVDLTTPIKCTNLSLLGGFRYSALYGHTRFTNFEKGTDDFVTGIDTQLGVQYSRGSLNIRALVESQLWANATEDPSDSLASESNSDDDLGFLGFVLGVEYVF
jgi:hypothetical protein